MSSPVEPNSDLPARLAEIFPAFERSFARWTRTLIENECGGTPARMRLLGALHCKGPQIMSNLGDELGVTARQVTNLVDALEKEQLVRRESHPTDRRATVIVITCKGAEMACQFWQPFHNKLAGLFGDLPEPDQRELLRLMESLLDSLRRKCSKTSAQFG